MIDGGLWNHIRPLLSPFGRMVRVENMLGLGTPDVHWTFGGRSGWIELKYQVPTKSAVFKIDSLTLDQVIWQEEEVTARGRATTLLKFRNHYLLLEPWLIRSIHDGHVNERYVFDSAIYKTVRIKPLELIQCLKT